MYSIKHRCRYALLACSLLLASCSTRSSKSVAYQGSDISHLATIVYDTSKQYRSVASVCKDEWSLYAATADNKIDLSVAALHAKGAGVFPISSGELKYQLYTMKTKEGQAILSDRLLPMQGGHNIRDLGGIRTASGRFVKWGRVLRGDELGNLTPADWRYLGTMPLGSIVDFRSHAEVQAKPDNAPEFIPSYVHLPIAPGNLTARDMDFILSTDFDGEQFMMDLYVQLVSDSVAVGQYRQFFNMLQSAGYTPLLFHCTAGKDRTGMAAALFLASLGVEEEAIYDNYLESNKHLEAKYSNYIASNAVLRDLMTVKRKYLQAGLDYIEANHGSVQNYLANVMGVDLKVMQSKYLY